MRLRLIAFVPLSALLAAGAEPSRSIPEITEAFHHLYNFDFPGTRASLQPYMAQHPKEALPHAVQAASYLFYELDRLSVLEAQFFANDKQIASKRKLQASPEVRASFDREVAATQSRALETLRTQPDDLNANFAMSVSLGLTADYQALVDKRQFASVFVAKQANQYAQRLLRLKPPFNDAYVSTGISEYLLGSAPFFVRWFVHFDSIDGNKNQGVRDLELAARDGVYLGPFARILLSIIYLREKNPERTRALLTQLAREFPGNPLYSRELNRLK